MNNGMPAYDSPFEASAGSAHIPADYGRLWSVILAGGNGDRLRNLIHRWKGRPVPKQYCAFTGKSSMLQHTLRRAEALSRPEHAVVVIAQAHQRDAVPQLADRWSRKVVLQPSNRDTLPGIFLPLSHVYARDRKATVAIYPSDHFIYPEDAFQRVMQGAVQAVEDMPHMLVLVGVPADSPEEEYGWICPGRQIWKHGEHSVRSVTQFLEKPSRASAAAALAGGGMWNTLILVAKVQTLWDLGHTYFPEILCHYERLVHAIGTSRELRTLESIYELLPARNFSADLLTQTIGRTAVLPMEAVSWSDWGRADRILATLHRLGKQPNFPLEFASIDGNPNQKPGPAAPRNLIVAGSRPHPLQQTAQRRNQETA